MKQLLIFFMLVGVCLAQVEPVPEPTPMEDMRMIYQLTEDSFHVLAAPAEGAAEKTKYHLFSFYKSGFPRWNVAKLNRDFLKEHLNQTEATEEETLPLDELTLEELARELPGDDLVYRFGLRRGLELRSASEEAAANETSTCFTEESEIIKQLSLLNKEWAEITEEVENVEDAEVRVFTTSVNVEDSEATIKCYSANKPVEFEGKQLGPDRIKIDMELSNFLFDENMSKFALISVIEANDEISKEEGEAAVNIGTNGKIEWVEQAMVNEESVDIIGSLVEYELALREEDEQVEAEEGREIFESAERSGLVFCAEEKEEAAAEQAGQPRTIKWDPTLIVLYEEEAEVAE